ncbi:hypothetical protein KC345_g1890 [Hortaea werneckii]|nr:hypothetical protein KC345_g1890 [Hortaea werneckii]
MPTVSKHSPLLALPKELRLMIYDELFTPLIQRPEHFDTYVLPSEWPKVDFTPYRALLLTCKEVKEEATTHFEGHFLREVMVYFDNVVDFGKFYYRLAGASHLKELANMQVCLHSLPSGLQRYMTRGTMACFRFSYINNTARHRCFGMLMFDWTRNKFVEAPESYAVDELADTCKAIHGPFERWSLDPNRTNGMRGTTKVDVFGRHGRSQLCQATFEVSSRQLCPEVHTMYTQVVAPASCLGCDSWIMRESHLKADHLDEVRKETGASCWPGIEKYEQQLKEEYGLDA